jgi:hypothetical protein
MAATIISFNALMATSPKFILPSANRLDCFGGAGGRQTFFVLVRDAHDAAATSMRR